MDFYIIMYWNVSLKFVDIFQFWLKSDKNDGHFTWRLTSFSALISNMYNYLNIYGRKKCFKRFRENETRTFYVSLTVFETIERDL
jgi:hypothetical protein